MLLRCLRCNHIISDAPCIYCGNTTEANLEYQFDDKVSAADQAKIIESVKNEQFDSAINLINKVLERSRNHAGSYYIKHLIVQEKTNTLEMLYSGFDPDNSFNFCNALEYSSGEERSLYENIKKIIVSMKESIIEELCLAKKEKIRNQDIVKFSDYSRSFLNSQMQSVDSMWEQLSAKESAMHSIDLKCELLVKEAHDNLNEAVTMTEKVVREVYKKEECSPSKYDEHSIALSSARRLSEAASSDFKGMKGSHPLVKEFVGITQERTSILYSIDRNIEAINEHTEKMAALLEKIDSIEKEYDSAIKLACIYDFTEAEDVLGKERIIAIYQRVVTALN